MAGRPACYALKRRPQRQPGAAAFFNACPAEHPTGNAESTQTSKHRHSGAGYPLLQHQGTLARPTKPNHPLTLRGTHAILHFDQKRNCQSAFLPRNHDMGAKTCQPGAPPYQRMGRLVVRRSRTRRAHCTVPPVGLLREARSLGGAGLVTVPVPAHSSARIRGAHGGWGAGCGWGWGSRSERSARLADAAARAILACTHCS